MISSKAFIINDTIEKNKRVFKIPVYQRNYEWKSVQCKRLFDDILVAFKNDKIHFTGAIVYIAGDKNSSSLTEDLIIDGQQRITSVMLLIKALLDIAVDKNESIQAELRDLLFNRHCDEKNKLKLKPVTGDDEQFQALMNNNVDCFNSNSQIIRNYKYFKILIEDALNKGYLLSEILEGMKQLIIVEIVLDKSQGDDPQVIFESINSTGLILSLADKIRNFVLMDDENQNELYNKYWKPMEDRIGSDGLADYFITFLDSRISDKVSKDSAYDKFKNYCISNNYSHEYILKELTQYSKYYAAFIGKPNTYPSNIQKLLNDFLAMDQSTLYPFLFHVFCDYDNNIISCDILYKVLNFLKCYSIRRIICDKTSNSLKGLYKSLYSRLFKDESRKSEYYSVIYSFFTRINTQDKLVSDVEFADSLIYKKLYMNKKVCKYLLSTLENNDSNEILVTDNLTIEHILPQKENAIVWKKSLGNDYLNTYQTYLHTLGNLTITGYNSELGTKSFADKKKIIEQYSKANVLNEDVLSQTVWNEKAILNRANHLTKKILEIFKIEKTKTVEFFDVPSDSQVYSLTDTLDPAHLVPCNYTFLGETVNVKNNVDMLVSFVNLLFDLDSSILEKLAKDNFKLTKSDSIYISTDRNSIRKPREISNSGGIFYESNLSAEYILLFIKALIQKYNIDLDDFSFVCKSDKR